MEEEFSLTGGDDTDFAKKHGSDVRIFKGLGNH